MKMRRFTGTDMRDALRQVREALGPDAVILETTRGPQGVEISAAMDETTATGTATPRPVATGRPVTSIDYRDTDVDPCVVVDGGPLPGSAGVPTGGWYQPPPRPAAATASELDQMREEMRSIRSLLEAQLGRLIWDDQARQSAEVAQLLRNFAQLGLDADMARCLADRSAADHPVGGWTAVLRTLFEQLPVADLDLVADGGVYAVVGPTGVGKTTTIAKLAARAAQQHGPDAVGLITTDTFRVAAREQLDTFGQIMGVTVTPAPDTQALAEALAAFRNRRLVLVDTAGMSQRDPRLPEQLRRLAAPDTALATLLALPANLQSGAMQEIVDVFLTAQPAACILTKTDEATSLGAALSVLIRSGLALAYVANGQRVPEDLHLMRNRQSWLAKMAVELMRRENRVPDPDQLAHKYTEVATHAHA